MRTGRSKDSREIPTKMKDYKKLEDKLMHGKIVRGEPIQGSFRPDERLFRTAIHVNANRRLNWFDGCC
jgi:hypothetical protein